MKSLFFKAKWIPTKEKYTMQDLPKVTEKELKSWIEETKQKMPHVDTIVVRIGYIPDAGEGDILEALIKATVEEVFQKVTEDYKIPNLYNIPSIAIYKEVKEEDRSKVINIVGYSVMSWLFKKR